MAAAAYVAAGVTSRAYRYQAVVTLRAPVETVSQYTSSGFATVEAVDADSCLLRTGFESLDSLALYLGLFGVDFEVHEPPELKERLRVVAERLIRGT
jgi:predicted DNA-binding transcriptional regulator YafY